MAIPETITTGVARRAGQHAFAMVVSEVLRQHGASVLDWWVDLTGEVRMRVRLDGGAVRTFEFVAVPAQQPTVQAAILARFDLLEAHVD